MFTQNIKAVLCDIGGVLYVGDAAIEGALEALERVKEKYPIRFLTNTTQKTSAEVVQKLQELGFSIEKKEVITALDMTKMFLENHKSYAEFLLTDNAIEFFEELKEYPKNYVVVGDAQHNFSYNNLNKGFRTLQKGAKRYNSRSDFRFDSKFIKGLSEWFCIYTVLEAAGRVVSRSCFGSILTTRV
ncbi:MAG: hypothetical protein ABXS93_09830 [Sulfurimonas sp.]